MAWIAPSILSADFMRLGQDIRKMEEAGARILHVDVMDGHFVPNISVGLPVVEKLRKCTDLILDVHLMISNPEQMADDFVSAGADYLSVHVETVVHLDRLMERIREKGGRPGVAVNPHTNVILLEEILPKCHHVLVMSVNPGFGGQEFIPSSLQKIRRLKQMIRSAELDVKIEIDGGMKLSNTEEVVRSGTDIVVAGSTLFHARNSKGAFRQMQMLADQASVKAKNDVLISCPPPHFETGSQ